MGKQAASLLFDCTGPELHSAHEPFAQIASKIIDLVEAALDSDFATVRNLGSALVHSAGGSQDPEVAFRLKRILRGHTAGSTGTKPLPLSLKQKTSLVDELPWPATPLFLDTLQSRTLGRFVAEIKAADKLAQHGLAPRSCLLLEGPPGTGKTLAAGHIANRLGLPFYVVRLDAVVSSLLGDTARNVRSIFDHIAQRPGVLLLDEFDALAKRRDDSKDVGELKRVVNALLQCLDLCDPRLVVVAATNHANLLDPAVWRRFPYRVKFELPSEELRQTLWVHYLDAPISEGAAKAVAKLSADLSCSDISEVALAARRSAIIEDSPLSLPGVILSLVQMKAGIHVLPDAVPLEDDERKQLWDDLKEHFGLAPSEIACLWSTTRQNVEKQIRQWRCTREGANGRKSGSPTEGVPAQGKSGRQGKV